MSDVSQNGPLLDQHNHMTDIIPAACKSGKGCARVGRFRDRKSQALSLLGNARLNSFRFGGYRRSERDRRGIGAGRYEKT